MSETVKNDKHSSGALKLCFHFVLSPRKVLIIRQKNSRFQVWARLTSNMLWKHDKSYILAANSLNHAIKTLPQALQDYYQKRFFASLALSFSPELWKVNEPHNSNLVTSFVIKRMPVNLARYSELSKRNKPWTPSQLFAVLKKYRECNEAIVFSQRGNTRYPVRRSTLFTTHIMRNIVSRRNQIFRSSLKEYKQSIKSVRLNWKA